MFGGAIDELASQQPGAISLLRHGRNGWHGRQHARHARGYESRQPSRQAVMRTCGCAFRTLTPKLDRPAVFDLPCSLEVGNP